MSGKSFTAVTGIVLISATGYFVWPGPKIRANNAERARIEQEVRAKKQAEADTLEAARREAERVKWEAITKNATNKELKLAIQECKDTIESSLSKNTAGFAVYFPKYTEEDLDKIYASSIAMRMNMGRPSSIATERDPDAEALKHLREFPSLPIDITVESANDSFSGVKKWAANYKCRIKGIKVEAISAGQKYFFD